MKFLAWLGERKSNGQVKVARGLGGYLSRVVIRVVGSGGWFLGSGNDSRRRFVIRSFSQGGHIRLAFS